MMSLIANASWRCELKLRNAERGNKEKMLRLRRQCRSEALGWNEERRASMEGRAN